MPDPETVAVAAEVIDQGMNVGDYPGIIGALISLLTAGSLPVLAKRFLRGLVDDVAEERISKLFDTSAKGEGDARERLQQDLTKQENEVARLHRRLGKLEAELAAARAKAETLEGSLGRIEGHVLELIRRGAPNHSAR